MYLRDDHLFITASALSALCLILSFLFLFYTFSRAGQSSVYNDLHGHKRASSSSSKKDLLVSVLLLVLVSLLQPQAWRQCRLIGVACSDYLLFINFTTDKIDYSLPWEVSHRC